MYGESSVAHQCWATTYTSVLFVMESDYVANLKDCPHYPFFSYNETFALDVFKVTIAGLHLFCRNPSLD